MTERMTAGNWQAAIGLLTQRMETMGASVEELKGMVKELVVSVGALEKREIRCQAEVIGRADTNHLRIMEHEKQLETLEKWREQADKILTKLNLAYGVLVFLGSALGISVIGLIWSLITGHAVVMFK